MLNAKQSASGWQAAVISAAQLAWSLLFAHVRQVWSGFFGVAAQRVAAHSVPQTAALQMHVSCAVW